MNSKYIKSIKKGDDTYDIKATMIEDCYIDGLKFNGSKSIYHYGICKTGSLDENKVIEVDGDIKLKPGLMLYIKFIYGIENTDSEITFNVNSSGQKSVDFGNNNKFNYGRNFPVNQIQLFVYDNDQFYWMHQPTNAMNFFHGRHEDKNKKIDLVANIITMIPLSNNFRENVLLKDDPAVLHSINFSGYDTISTTSKENGTTGGIIIPETGYYQVSGGASFIAPYNATKPNRRLDVYIDGISGDSDSDKRWSLTNRVEIADGATFVTVPYNTQIPVIVGPKIVFLEANARIYLSARITNWAGRIDVGHKDTYLDIKYIGNTQDW